MAVRKLKPIEERDPYAAAVLDAFDRMDKHASLDDGTWHCMTDAPKDGTEVELLLRHQNYAYAKTDEQRAMWEQVVLGKWIDFNGGGWTWHGMNGRAWGWRPMTPNAPHKPRSEAESA